MSMSDFKSEFLPIWCMLIVLEDISLCLNLISGSPANKIRR